MTTEIARGVVRVDIEDEGVLAALRKVDAEFDRTMSKIERSRAEADATLDISDLKKAAREAEAELRRLDAIKAEAEVDLDISQVRQNAKNARREIKALKGLKAEGKLELDDDEFQEAMAAARTAIAIFEGRKAQMDLVVNGQDEARRAIRGLIDDSQALEKAVEGARRRREAAARAAEAAATRADAADKRRLQAMLKEEDSVHRLNSEYVKLIRRVESFDSLRRRAARTGDRRSVLQVDIDHRGALHRMARIREALEEAGEPLVIDDVRVHPGRELGHTLRNAFATGGNLGALRQVGQSAGETFNKGFRDRAGKFNKASIGASLVGGLSAGLTRLGSLADGFANASVRLGPFTTSVKGALVGLSALGPVIISLVGSMAALVGVTASAAAGLGALGVAFLGGAIPAAIGMFAVLKPLTAQFGSAMKASKAYRQALMKGNEDLAAKKLKELRSVLGNVDKETVSNFKNAGDLAGRWEKLTAPSRASAFKVIGGALNLAGNSMVMFASKTNDTFNAVERSLSRTIKGIGSLEGQKLLGNLMDNFNRSLRPGLDGLANLGTYMARLGSVASNVLPGMSGQFERWSRRVADGGRDTGRLQAKVDGWVDSLRTLGRFLSAGAGLLKTFFSGGTAAGKDLLNTMTAALNRWNDFLRSAQGQESLAEFFRRASTGARSLFSAIAPIASAFVGWASALSPIVSGFFRGAGAIANFIAQILRMTALQGPVTALAATLGALWAVGKVAAMVQMVGNLTRALFGLQAAGLAAGASGVAGGAAGGAAARGAAGAAATGAAAGVAAGKVGLFRRAATALIPAIAGLGAVAGGAATLGVGALAAGAAYGVVKVLSLKSAAQKAQGEFDGLAGKARGAARSFGLNLTALENNNASLAEGRYNLKLLREQLGKTKKGTDEYAIAQHRVRQQQVQNNRVTRDNVKGLDETKRASERQLRVEEKRLVAARRALDGSKKGESGLQAGLKAAIPFGFTQIDKKKTGEELGKVTTQFTRQQAAVEKARNRIAAYDVSLARVRVGLEGFRGAAEQSVGQLARLDKGLAKKIGLKFEDPQKAGRVARAASSALKAGVPKSVATKIVVDSKSPKAAIAALNRQKVKAIIVRITQIGGGGVTNILKSIAGTKLGAKVQKILAQDGGVRAKIQALRALGIPTKIAKVIAKDEQALATLRRLEGTAVKSLTQTINRLLGVRPELVAPGPVAQLVNRTVRTIGNIGLGGGANRPPSSPRFRGGGTADGGLVAFAGGTGATPDPGRIRRAANEAVRRPTRDLRAGGRVARPTLLTGEENRPEFVIATNPRYRERNLGFLRAAARALGSRLEDDDGGRASGFEGGLFAAGGTGSAVARSSGRKSVPGSRRKALNFRGRQTKALTRVNKLRIKEDSQIKWADHLERRIDEPESFLLETAQKGPGGDPIFAVNEPVLAQYLKEMGAIEAAYAAIAATIKRLQSAIPPAISEQQAARETARRNISVVKDQVAKEERATRTTGDSKEAKARRKAAQGRLAGPNGLRAKLRTQERALADSSADLDSLKTERSEIPDRLLQAEDKLAEYKEDIAAVDPKARKSAKDANGTGGGATSESDDVRSYQSARLELLRDYGSNFVENFRSSSGQGATPAASPLAAAGASLTAGSSSAIDSLGAGAGQAAAALSASGSSFSGASRAGALSASPAPVDSPGGAASSVAAPPDSGSPEGGAVTVNNYFQKPPQDPHSWSKGIEFELGAL